MVKKKSNRRIIAPKSLSRDLVLVDSEPLRTKFWRLYQNAVKKYETAAAELRQFKDVDTGRYRLWYEGEFSADVIKLRDTQSAVADLASWIDQIQTYASVREIPPAVSFEILSQAQEEGLLEQLWQKLGQEIEEQEQKAKSRRRKKKEPETWKDIEDIFEQAFEEASGSYDTVEPREAKPDPAVEQSLRALFHQLAMRLHPDTNPEQDPAHRELFHAAQAAYRERDIEGLEEIWKRLEGTIEGVFSWKTAAIGELIKRKQAVELRYRDIRVELKFAKEHLAWNFSKMFENKNEMNKLRQKIRVSIREQQEKTDDHWIELNEFISRLEKASRRKKKAKKSR